MTRRQRLESAVERAIDLLNRIDGDPDLEPETDLGAGEDEGPAAFSPQSFFQTCRGPGCEVFDGV